ncbi:MAG: transketolase [Proteobacteria bacterium]|nr:transketolase [Pseudomonadota bacterium]
MAPRTPSARPLPAAKGAVDHRRMANAVRFLAIDAVEAAKSGHPGMPMGMADVASVLFTRVLKYDAADPHWPDRDRFVLSAGHGSMLLYALLYLAGYEGMTLDEIRNFRKLGSRTPGHPEIEAHPGIETTTGPLGQGLGNAVGMALAERLLATRFGPGLVDHRTYVIASDGDLMEGISHEACSLAGHLGLAKLVVLFDDNRISIDGPTSLATSDDALRRFSAYGWHTARVDGHDADAVYAAIEVAKEAGRPSLIACRTVIGYGAPHKAGSEVTHGSPLGAEEVAATRKALDWPHPPFEVPADVLAAWRAAGRAGADARRAWAGRLAESPERAEFERRLAGRLPEGWERAALAVRDRLASERPTLATRQASQQVVDALAAAVPEMVGGSADLTGSNGTFAKGMTIVRRGDFSGRYLHYGVREHAMAAAMNGMALHKGLLPYSGTFLVFSDYMRPSVRLAALMHQRVVFVFTHDSIGLGEDGPTHQPIEHLAALRAMPNLNVFRPADAVETAECWALALARSDGPSAIVLTRQAVPTLRPAGGGPNLSARGGYVLAEATGPRRATLFATGSEVSLAMAARERLAAEGVAAAVVSIPCWELFDAEPADYRAAVVGPCPVRVSVEAAAPHGWERYVGERGAALGLSRFGASAPFAELYAKFGLTPEAVVAAVRARL